MPLTPFMVKKVVFVIFKLPLSIGILKILEFFSKTMTYTYGM